MSLGSNIRRYRKALKLTQTELADKIGVQTSAVSKIERGVTDNLKQRQLETLCRLFSCTPADLYGIETVKVTSSHPLTPEKQRLIALIPILDDDQVNLLLDVVKAITNANI